MEEELTIVIFMLLLVLACVSVGYLAKDDINSLIRKVRNNPVGTPEECVDLDLVDTAHCLNDYVVSIFKYKERKDLERPTLQELIDDGGDCKNWAELYMTHGEELGFNVKMPIIDTGEFKHAFAVISDETGYCKLDQMNLDCFMFGD